jgi:hypothetical protein
VLEVESARLLTIRNFYENKYEMADSWPDYHAHITLSYSYSGELPTVELPDGEQLTGTASLPLEIEKVIRLLQNIYVNFKPAQNVIVADLKFSTMQPII